MHEQDSPTSVICTEYVAPTQAQLIAEYHARRAQSDDFELLMSDEDFDGAVL